MGYHDHLCLEQSIRDRNMSDKVYFLLNCHTPHLRPKDHFSSCVPASIFKRFRHQGSSKAVSFDPVKEAIKGRHALFKF